MSADGTEVAGLLVGALAQHGVRNLWFTSGTELTFFREAWVQGPGARRAIVAVQSEGVPAVVEVPLPQIGTT